MQVRLLVRNPENLGQPSFVESRFVYLTRKLQTAKLLVQ